MRSLEYTLLHIRDSSLKVVIVRRHLYTRIVLCEFKDYTTAINMLDSNILADATVISTQCNDERYEIEIDM